MPVAGRSGIIDFVNLPEGLSMRTLTVCTLVLGLVLTAVAADKEADAKQTKADLAAFKEFIEKHKLNERWKGDPARLDSEELRAAFPGQRAYYTFVMPPLPPGAALPELIEAHKKRTEEWLKSASLRMAVLIDDKGNITVLKKPEDFAAAIKEIKTDAEAKVAAAAVLSLFNVEAVAPAAVPAKDVKVTKTDKGWTCTYEKERAFKGTVTMDARGKVTAATKELNFIMPLPPSAPPAKP